jgi:hypothetical protein
MEELIKILGLGATVTAGLVWLAKIVISRAIDAGGDAYKNRLASELEVHKSNLDMMKIQYQIQYSTLNEKRGEIIAKLYSVLYDLEQDLMYYTSLAQGAEWVSDMERDKKAMKTFSETKEIFEKNRIYFSENLCNKLENVLIEREEVIKNMRKAKIIATHIGQTKEIQIGDTKKPMEIWMKQEEIAREEIVESRKQLADEFRSLIGVEINSTSPGGA